MPVFMGEVFMTFSFGSNRREQKRRRGDKTYSIRSEEELARELASRGISMFRNGSGDFSRYYIFCGLFLLLMLTLLSSHVGIFSDYYAVQCARFTGDYAETGATIVSQSSRIEESYYRKDNGRRATRRETYYSVKIVSDDGTSFSFDGTRNYGRKGDRVIVKYSKGEHRTVYVTADFLHMPFERYIGILFLFLAGLPLWGAFAMFRKIRKYQMVLARRLYLPVQMIRYESETLNSHKVYAPVYRYEMPSGSDLFFQDETWSSNIPKVESANKDKVFRVYMMDPEDPGNDEFFIKEIRRRSARGPGQSKRG